MRRILLTLLGLFVIGWFEFTIYPGHTYLASTSQLYVSILQKLSAPGYLTRDMVATHPNVTYTAYDEVTLALAQLGRCDFEVALAVQHLFCRMAGTLGILFIARSTGLSNWKSLVASAMVGLGTYLNDLNLHVMDTEAVPEALALGLVLAAIGFLARVRPLLAGFFGGMALIYSPIIAAPFWITMLVAFTSDKRARRLGRPMLPILLIFVLLLANLAQLQPAIGSGFSLRDVLPVLTTHIEKVRIPELWVSLWDRTFIHLFIGLLVIGIAATTRIWPELNGAMRWCFTFIPLCGVLSIPVSFLLLDELHLAAVPRVEPLEMLVVAAAIIWIACVIAGLRSIRGPRKLETIAWLAVSIFFAIAGAKNWHRTGLDTDTRQLADWAENRTWGSSVFLFPDAGRSSKPGAFRAQSRRGLWVDWGSGLILKSYPQLAPEWWMRWKRCAANLPTSDDLAYDLTQPVDYYVLRRSHVFQASSSSGVKPIPAVYVNNSYVVYDANDLRAASGDVRVADSLQ
jgi:hypothetical protein